MKGYHVTPLENLDTILEEGLVAQVGERSSHLGERPSIFFFPTREDCDSALSGWLGEEFEDIFDELVILECEIPDGIEVFSSVEYEFQVFQNIDPSAIVCAYDEYWEPVDIGNQTPALGSP